MHHSFLHPDYSYNDNINVKHNLQAPNIFVVPPEEDDLPPWCCFDATQRGSTVDQPDIQSSEYQDTSLYTPFCNRSLDGLHHVGSTRKSGSAETRSIVDALGDAEYYSDNDIYHTLKDTDFDDREDYNTESISRQPYSREYANQQTWRQAQLEQKEVGNDSDVIEVIKVRRRNIVNNDEAAAFTSKYGYDMSTKSSFRSRASRAFQSLKGTLRSTSKSSEKPNVPHKPLAMSNTVKSSTLSKYSKSKTQSKTRAQDIFPPIETHPEPDMATLFRRPSSRLSQMFSASLKRRPSAASFTPSTSPPSTALPSENPEPNSPPLSRRSSANSNTTPTRRSSATYLQKESIYHEAVESTPTRKSYQRPSDDDDDDDDERTPSWRSFVTQRESPSASRSTSPTPSTQRPNKRFSVLNLSKKFQKHSEGSENHSTGVNSHSSPSTSDCPSLTFTSENSGRTTPTTDSSPQTPTSWDENEIRRSIVPVASCSTVGSGISLGTSAYSAAVSSLAGSSTMGSNGTVSSEPGVAFISPVPSGRASTSTSGSQTESQADDLFFGSKSSIPDGPPQTRSSFASILSANNDRPSAIFNVPNNIDGLLEGTSTTPHIPDMSLNLDLDLHLGLDINLVPSSSGGFLSSNGLGDLKANQTTLPQTRSHPVAMPSRPSTKNVISRNLSLKSLSSKLGLRHRTEAPSVPPVLVDPIEEADMSMEMRLDSLHFDDISFDTEKLLRNL